MSEHANLMALRCPTCGGELMAENETDKITCVYCGNTIVPVAKTDNGEAGSAVRVEGIRTPSSALAYLELLFEEYDWDSFAYAQTLSIPEVNAMADSLKVASADDKNTWLLCFRAIAEPLAHKAAGCDKILASVIAAYKNGNLDAYSIFDAYKRISAMITGRKEKVLAELSKILGKAAQYGATDREQAAMKDKLRELEKATDLHSYPDIESIPEIMLHNRQTDARIKQQLAAKGIDADARYAEAKRLLQEGKNTEALQLILTLEGYADSDQLRQKADKYFRIDDVLEVAGKFYCFQKDPGEEKGIKCLYGAQDGHLGQEPLIRGIREVVTNYASILYYLTAQGKLKKFDLATGENATVYPEKLYTDGYYLYDWKGYFYAEKSGEDEEAHFELIRVDLRTGDTEKLLENVHEVVAVWDNMMVYKVRQVVSKDDYEIKYSTETCIFDVDTRDVLKLGKEAVTIVGFLGEQAVYTRPAPDQKNLDLFLQPVDGGGPERLVERNIYQFCAIEAGKLFYYVGNAWYHSLITVDADGTGRTQWPGFVSRVLFEQGGRLYFIREAGHNSVLCRSRLDGSRFQVIASGIKRFVELKNGYLYYISKDNALIKVRMDGSNLQTLCRNVDEVLSVQEDKVLFASEDEKITQESMEGATYRFVDSIYCVEFSGSGMSKLAYDVQEAAEYDDGTVYYIAEEKASGESEAARFLYRLDVETKRTEKLLELQPVTPQEPGISGFAIAMILAAAGFLLGFMGLMSEVGGMAVLGFIGGVVALCIGAFLKKDPDRED